MYNREPPPGPLTYDEFLAWCDEDTLAEWVRGEVQMSSPASLKHQDLARFLLVLLSHWVEHHQWGVVLSAPFQMRLPEPISTGREPDLLLVAREHRDRLHPTYLDGPADVAIEIVSPESISRDRGEKFVEYEQAGVREYWLIDPARRQAEFYRLSDDGRYQLALGGALGTYASAVLPGFELPVAWLWREPLPAVFDALRDLGLLT